MIRIIVQVIINALALAVAVLVLTGVDLTASAGMVEAIGGDETLANVLAFLLVGLIFGVVNALVRPIVKFLSLPLTCLTLGLFALVINTLMVLLTAWLSEYTPAVLSVENFWWGLGASIIISLTSAVLDFFTRRLGPAE
ncbi:phage holin family protein [Micrococcoides hystricis]|uniref:Phage holin family protein n=1 Tax=Micrococcoides hystricis TaxID=1572761 RepID=A0ABV6P7U5_9MICC